MDKATLEMYFGKRIIIQWEHEVGDQKRKHKKKRINKKWLKRYGTWQESDGACPKGYAIYFNGTLFVSRHTYIEIKHYRKYLPRIGKVGHHGNNFARIRYDI